MGSIVYDFLNESFLFDENHMENYYSSISEIRLKLELDNYREFILKNIEDLHGEIKSDRKKIKIFGAKDYFTVDHLAQTAFYIDQVILPDPLFPFTITQSDINKTMNQFLGMSDNDSISRVNLSSALKKMKSLTPMVAANYIKFFPVSYYLEPSDTLPVTHPENGGFNLLPSDILEKYREKATVKSLKKSADGWIIENELKVGRGISIAFEGDDEENVRVYNLFEQKILSYDKETRIANIAMVLPDTPPPVDYFQAWVSQSINQAARGHYEEMIKGMIVSSNYDASYMTSSPFTHSLLGRERSNSTIEGYTTECVINMDLPFLENISIYDLMSVRDNDGESFNLFRAELERHLREIRLETDPEIIRVKTQNAVHELSEVQVEKIGNKINEIRKGALAQTAVAVGGLAGSVVTSGWSIAATAIAIANGFKTYSEFREKVRENPSYFLWRVKNA